MLRRRLLQGDTQLLPNQDVESSTTGKSTASSLRKVYTPEEATERRRLRAAKKRVGGGNVEEISSQTSASLLDTFNQGQELEAVVLGAEDELLEELEKAPLTKSRKVSLLLVLFSFH